MSRSSSSSFLLFLVILTLISSAFAAASPSLHPPRGKKILVLLDEFAVKSSHSLYFASLSSRGYDLDFKLSDDPSASLRHYSHYLYDGLILFCPSTERFGGSIDQAAILEFVDSGHDLIIAADANASELIKEIATECGVDFDEDSSAMVVDHLSYSVSEYEGDHTLIVANDFIEADIILGNEKIKAPVLFQGIGHSINPANSLVFKVLSASPAAYSANAKSKLSAPPSLSGSAISLVSVMQARNNARVLISGSLSMFSNRFFRSKVPQSGATIRHQKAGNEQFLTEISKWIFHERGHLQAVNVRHNKAGEVDEPAMYRINDDLEYSVEIYEWSGTSWEPYAANDVQVQFYMMSPYVLKTLSADKRGVFSTSFKVPDVYGVFQFKVEYQRLGYTELSLSKQIPVRPFRHNEYERFIPTAYPYYGATFSMMAGFFLFTFVHLYNKSIVFGGDQLIVVSGRENFRQLLRLVPTSSHSIRRERSLRTSRKHP